MEIPAEDLRGLSELYDQGKYLTAYRQAERFGPLENWRGPDAIVLAGKLAGVLGARRLGQAIHYRAWRRHPDNACLWYYVTWARLQRRGPLAAIRHLERFIDNGRGRRPIDGRNQSDRRINHSTVGSIIDKLPDDLSPTIRADWLGGWAHCHALLRDFENAEQAMDKAMSLTPDRAWLWVELASILELKDREEESLEASRRALELRPFYRPAVQQACHALVQLNRDDEALELLHSAIEEIESGSVLGQLASLQIELRKYEEARENLERLDHFFPLGRHDKDLTRWLAARRSDAAYYCGDYRRALELAKEVDQPFFKSVAKRMEANGSDGRRVELKLGFVRQHHVTCAPATLSAICRYWDLPYDHLEVAEDICYDGTPNHNERHWAEDHGFHAREFRVTWESSKALIDAGIPFVLSTVMPGAAHAQAVFGYDSRRGVLLVRDPNERHFSECLAEEMIEQQSPTGPRGMAFVAKKDNERLAAIDLPDAALYDDYHALQRALHKHDRDTAEEAFRRMSARDAEHHLAVHGRASLAAYDADHVTLTKCTEKILRRFPDDVNQQTVRLRLLRENGTRRERLAMLKEICARPECDPIFRQRYADELLEDSRELERGAYVVRRAMCARPLDAESFRLTANICWMRQQREEAFRLRRFAACLDDKNEAHSMDYFTASRFLNRTEEALSFLEERFQRLGALKSWAAETLSDAYDQLDQGDKSLKVLEDALRLRPDDGDSMLAAARYYARMNRDEQAAELLKRAKGRSHPLAWRLAMARHAWCRNDLPETLRFGKMVIEADPFNRETNNMVIDVLCKLQGREAAEQHQRELVDRFPFHYLLRSQLIELLHDETPGKKEAEIRKLLDLHSEDPWARRELAVVLARQQRFDEAMREARTAVELEESNPAGQFILGVIHEERGEVEQARQCCRRAVELSVDYDPAADKLMGLCRSKAERQETLEFLYEQLVDQVVFGEGLLTFRAVATGTLEPERLLKILREALAVRPDLWQAWAAVVYQLIDMDRAAQAVETAKAAHERFPLLPRILLDLAMAYRATEDHSDEISAIEKALTLNPSWDVALRQLCDAQRAAGDLDAARATIDKAIAHEPQNETHKGELAELLWMQGERSEAIAVMKEAVGCEPRYEWGWRRLTDWAHAVRDPELTVELGRDIVAQRPESPDAWMVLATILRDLPKHFAECLQAVDRATALRPRFLDAHWMRADLLAFAGHFDEAVAACRPEVFGSEQPVFLRAKMAAIESQRGNVEGACEQMRAVVADDPEYSAGWSQLADWYALLEDDDKHLDAARNLVRTAPKSAIAWGYLGDGMLRTGDREKAKEYLHKAQDIDQRYVFAGTSLFRIYMEDQQSGKALKAIRTAGAELPDDYRLACEIRALSIMKALDDARELLVELCRCKMEDAALLQEAVEAMWAAGASKQVTDVLSVAIDDPQASPQVAVAWLVRAGDHVSHHTRDKLKKLDHRSERWHVLCLAYISLMAERRLLGKLTWFVRRNRGKIRANTRTWAVVGSIYRDLQQDKDVVRWMRDWRKRGDLEANMLFPLVLAHLARGSNRKAATVANHALTLTIDHTFDFHLAWLVAIELLRGDVDAAAEYFSRINPTGYHEYYQQLYGLVRVTLEILQTHPWRSDWATARRKLDEARARFQPENWADRVVRKLYWRCRGLAAWHHGKPLRCLYAKIRAAFQ